MVSFKLTFEEHASNAFNKVNEIIGLLRKLQNLLPRTTLKETGNSYFCVTPKNHWLMFVL